MKKKLYCFFGGFTFILMLSLWPARFGESVEKPVSGIFRKYAEEEMPAYFEKESPAASYMVSGRAQILDYDTQKEGQDGKYSSDLLNVKGSIEEQTKEQGTDEEGTGKEEAEKEKEKSKKTGEEKAEPEKTKKKKSKKSRRKKSAKNKEVISLTKREKAVLLRIVEAEATGEDVMGRMLVANVVLNRVKSEIFPNNVIDVVYANSDGIYQFSPIRDGRFWQVNISSKTRKAVKRVLCGEDYSEGALYFMARRSARNSSVSWFETHLTMVKQYGGHEFYK